MLLASRKTLSFYQNEAEPWDKQNLGGGVFSPKRIGDKIQM